MSLFVGNMYVFAHTLGWGVQGQRDKAVRNGVLLWQVSGLARERRIIGGGESAFLEMKGSSG